MITPKEALTYRKNLWCAYRDSVVELADNDEADDNRESLLTALDAYIGDFQRRIDGLPDTLEHLADLKHGLRSAIELMEFMQERYEAELVNWLPGRTPVNGAEQLYGILQQIIFDLSTAVWSIEKPYPKLKHAFDADRKTHHRLRQQWAEYEKNNPIQ